MIFNPPRRHPTGAATGFEEEYPMTSVVKELGCYVLPGKASSPIAGIQQAIEAERIGLGSVWASERWETKESGALLGAIAQATTHIRLVTGTTHFNTRHPMVLAGMAATLQGLSGGRFEMGVARSVVDRWKKIGAPPQTNQSMADMAGILKQLWAGETVSYSGPAGNFPEMLFVDLPDKSTPIHLAAVGPKTLALAGAHFDGVILHPFLTPHGVARSADIVRQAAEQAGRDPASVRIIAAVVVAPDLTPEETRAAVYARAATYFVHKEMAMPILRANEWDPAQLEPILATGLEELEMQQVSVEVLRAKMAEASALIPRAWLDEGAAMGAAATVAARLREYRAAGADEILLHGATADKLEGLVSAYRTLAAG
jgi:probable F420-dependent oxidoreductase